MRPPEQAYIETAAIAAAVHTSVRSRTKASPIREHLTDADRGSKGVGYLSHGLSSRATTCDDKWRVQVAQCRAKGRAQPSRLIAYIRRRSRPMPIQTTGRRRSPDGNGTHRSCDRCDTRGNQGHRRVRALAWSQSSPAPSNRRIPPREATALASSRKRTVN